MQMRRLRKEDLPGLHTATNESRAGAGLEPVGRLGFVYYLDRHLSGQRDDHVAAALRTLHGHVDRVEPLRGLPRTRQTVAEA